MLLEHPGPLMGRPEDMASHASGHLQGETPGAPKPGPESSFRSASGLQRGVR